jgi:Zinc-finger associated domain (zf-AD)
MEADNTISIEFMGKTMPFDSTNFCRCCLVADESLMLMANPGFNQADGSTLQSLYDSVCELAVTIHFAGQPQICESCVFDLRMAFDFRQMCVQANAKLEEIIQIRRREKCSRTAVVEVQSDNYIQEETNTVEPVKVKEEPVEQELFIADIKQIEAIAEVKMEEELTIIDHTADQFQNNEIIEHTNIKTEQEMDTLDEVNTEPDSGSSLAHNSRVSQRLLKNGVTTKRRVY